MERTITGQATMKKAAWSLALVLALMSAALLSAAPAMAQVSQGIEQESESDGVDLSFSVENSGNYAGQCTPALQFGNSGNLNNAPSSLQYASESDDFEPGGIEFSAEPGLAAECNQEVQQAAAASSAPKAEEKKAEAPKATPAPAPKAEAPKATPAPTPKAEAKAGAPEAKVEAPKVGTKAGVPEAKAAPKAEQPKAEQPKAAPKELPKTGGDTLPIVGVVGALLVGGGLLIRKLAW